MSNFVPTNEHLRHTMLFYFNQKKKAVECHKLIYETYGELSPSLRTCETWFRRFKRGDYDVKDKERSGGPKKYNDADLLALLNKNPAQTQKQLAEVLGVTQESISQRLKAMRNIKR